jgi:hypothetical protein
VGCALRQKKTYVSFLTKLFPRLAFLSYGSGGGAAVWVITAKFSVGGYRLPEVDLPPALAIGVIALTAYALLLHTPVGG